MGKKNRERIERIRAGLEKPFRIAVTLSSKGAIVSELSKGTVSEQVSRLSELRSAGHLPDSKLKAAIMRNAPKEIDKAIDKYRKQGKEITVDSLLVEVRAEKGFLPMCENLGLDYAWFERLAAERINAKGVIQEI